MATINKGVVRIQDYILVLVKDATMYATYGSGNIYALDITARCVLITANDALAECILNQSRLKLGLFAG
jgi:hypothetical protein